MSRTGRNDRRVRRALVVALGTILILAAGLYGPVTLLPPLPVASVRMLDLPASSGIGAASEVPLPVPGASAVYADGATDPLATSGSADPVPIGGASKVVAALVVLDERPLAAGRSGDSIPITSDDYASYLDYRDAGGRNIPVVEGDTWTQREVLQAVVLGSSNNHADTLVRWAFGSLDAYASAAGDWLSAHGLTRTTIVDPTGLTDRNTGTAEDMARLAELAAGNVVLSELLESPVVTTTRGYEISNQADFRVVDGVRGISRSFSDAAGVCLLFAVPLGGNEPSRTVYGAFLRQPSYDSLEVDMDEFLTGIRARAEAVSLVGAGVAVAEYRSAWGQTTTAVTRDGLEVQSLSGAAANGDVQVDDLRTVRAGDRVGTLRYEVDGTTREVVLVASAALTDPGPGWRLLSPGPMVGSLLSERGD
ncbi:serine hydrolase family protein [Planctomonas psychrotolerans]|uniref:hypothetical protein n=1 Tax=Planctomonas psychrotolerans TaxID=2528712 RepID=UPI00123B90C7|nr:hypothetical protein [Planctomonas psychrotolerans]